MQCPETYLPGACALRLREPRNLGHCTISERELDALARRSRPGELKGYGEWAGREGKSITPEAYGSRPAAARSFRNCAVSVGRGQDSGLITSWVPIVGWGTCVMAQDARAAPAPGPILLRLAELATTPRRASHAAQPARAAAPRTPPDTMPIHVFMLVVLEVALALLLALVLVLILALLTLLPTTQHSSPDHHDHGPQGL